MVLVLVSVFVFPLSMVIAKWHGVAAEVGFKGEVEMPHSSDGVELVWAQNGIAGYDVREVLAIGGDCVELELIQLKESESFPLSY